MLTDWTVAFVSNCRAPMVDQIIVQDAKLHFACTGLESRNNLNRWSLNRKWFFGLIWCIISAQLLNVHAFRLKILWVHGKYQD